MLRQVTPGRKDSSLWVIEDGLKSGERVITEGVQKVQEGMEVKPVVVAQPVPSPSGVEAAGASPALLKRVVRNMCAL
jgi:membrane fusion protein, multidrug efflux system